MTERLDRHNRRLRAIEDYFHIRRSPTPIPEPMADEETETREEVGGTEARE